LKRLVKLTSGGVAKLAQGRLAVQAPPEARASQPATCPPERLAIYPL